MAYSTDYPKAARRHLACAETLFADGPQGSVEAGYLYGLAAECALKAMARGYVFHHPGRASDSMGSGLFVHLPALRTMLRDQLQGRRQSVLRRFVENNNFMNRWEIGQRYAPTNEINAADISQWRTHTKELVDEMNSDAR